MNVDDGDSDGDGRNKNRLPESIKCTDTCIHFLNLCVDDATSTSTTAPKTSQCSPFFCSFSFLFYFYFSCLLGFTFLPSSTSHATLCAHIYILLLRWFCFSMFTTLAIKWNLIRFVRHSLSLTNFSARSSELFDFWVLCVYFFFLSLCMYLLQSSFDTHLLTRFLITNFLL